MNFLSWQCTGILTSLLKAKKKKIPKHYFMTQGKYLHLANLTAEDQNNLLCKVHLLVTCLEQKFTKAKNKYALLKVKLFI